MRGLTRFNRFFFPKRGCRSSKTENDGTVIQEHFGSSLTLSLAFSFSLFCFFPLSWFFLSFTLYSLLLSLSLSFSWFFSLSLAFFLSWFFLSFTFYSLAFFSLSLYLSLLLFLSHFSYLSFYFSISLSILPYYFFSN